MGPHRDQKLKKVSSKRCTEVKRLILAMPAALENTRCLLVKAGILFHVYQVFYINEVLFHFLSISFFRTSPVKNTAQIFA